MQGEVTRSDFITEPRAFAAAGVVPISSSRGYQSQDPTGSGACRTGQLRSQKKSRLQPFRERGEALEGASAGGRLTEPGNEVEGGNQSSPPRRSSLGSWYGASSSTQSGGAANEPPSQHPEYDLDAGDQQPPTASSHPTEMEVDDVEVSPHRWSDSVTLNRPPSPSAGAQAASDAGAIQDDDAGVDIVEK
jgi:hypothetical protein